MRTIEVLGPGCNNCRRVEANAREAIAMAGVEAEVVHVTDPREIVAHGIMSTPGLVIDGKVVSYGRVPSPGDIAAWLSEPQEDQPRLDYAKRTIASTPTTRQ
jgi:small redox-active disulfide protein 2